MYAGMGTEDFRAPSDRLSGVPTGVPASIDLAGVGEPTVLSLACGPADAVRDASCSLYFASSCALRSLNSFSSSNPSS